MTDRIRRGLLACAALAPLAPALAAEPLGRGALVQWPKGVTLIDGARWQPEAGQAVVVVFWSLHCGFCERHNEHVEKLHRAAAGKPLRVIGVLAESDREAARRRMAQRGWTFPLTVDREPLAAALAVRRSVPFTVTIDRQGRLRERIPGEMFEADVLELLKLASAG